MPFLGKQPNAGFASIVKDDFTADGSTTAFTLSKQVANANDIAVFVGNVRQEPTDAYTVNGTTLTMSAAPASAINFYVLHIAGTVESSVIPADGTISSAKIVSGAVTDAKITGMSSSKLTGALPALDGSALTGAGSMVKLAHTTLLSNQGDTYPFNFTSVFSSTYNNYFFTFTVASGALTTGNILYCQFGNSGTYVTASNAVRGSSSNLQTNSGASHGYQRCYSSQGIHQLNGQLTNTESRMFTGHGIIINPFSSYYPVNVMTKLVMQYFSTEANSWGEEGYSREDNGDKASYTDVRFGIIVGNGGYNDVASNASRRSAYGHITIYGMVD